MKNICFLLCLLYLPCLYGQVGVTGAYSLNVLDAPDLPGTELPLVDLSNGYEIQAHYWFRLPEHRVEFQPTLYYNSADINSVVPLDRFREYGFQFETNIYLFDLVGDCDCPTFGKQGPQLQKGFFLQLAPGIGKREVTLDGNTNDKAWSFLYGGGIGLDLGITNFLTLTPLATIRTGPGPITSVEVDPDFGQENDERHRLTSVLIGLQATFRFDHDRY